MAFDYKFQKITGKEIECSFTGGDISSDGGIVILSEADQKLQLSKQIASIYPDKRNNSKITHTCQKLIQQRLYGIALGYEDLNDHDTLRNCALFQTSLDSTTSLGSSSTLCRLENVADREFIFKSHKLMLELFMKSYKTPPREIILDFDATEDEVHGNQENKYYNGYYRHDCFLPLHVYCGKHLLVNYLRPSNEDQAKHSWAILALLVKGIRQHWPDVEIIFRADCGFRRDKMLNWCEKHGIKYIVGMGQNAILNKMLKPIMEEANKLFKSTRKNQKLFKSLNYKAKSWQLERKVVGKAEVTSHGENPRYIVTNLPGNAEYLYKKVYCARGDMENRIKEHQLSLFSDRTSAHLWWANQLRLVLSGFAYILMEYIRNKLLKGTELANSMMDTIRLKLLKVGTIIIRNTRKIKLLFASSYPYQHLWNIVFKKLSLE